MHRRALAHAKRVLKALVLSFKKFRIYTVNCIDPVESVRPTPVAAAPRSAYSSRITVGRSYKNTPTSDLGLDANLTSSNNCHARGWCGTACTTDAARCDAPANRAARPQARQPGRTAAAPGRQAGFKTSSQGRLSTTGTTRPMLTPMRSKPLCPAPAAPCPTGELSLWGNLAPACGELSLRLRSWRCRWAARAWARASVRLLTFFSLTSRLPTRYHD
jgi:hypothetical protein